VHFVVAMEKNSTVPTDSQVMTKNKTYPLNHSPACASYAIYLAIHTCKCKEGKKIGKVITRKVANKLRKQDP